MISTPHAPALIAFDMDGTLFDTQGRPLPSSLLAIAAAQARGTKIALASGRDAWALRKLADGFGVDPATLVFFGLNGSTIVDGATEKVLWSQPIAPALLARLLQHVRGFEVTPSISAGPHLYVEDVVGFNVEVESFFNAQELVVVDRLEEAPVSAYKLLLSAPAEVLAASWQAIAEPFDGVLDFAFSAPTHFEATDLGVNKGAALRHYCELMSIELANTVAFGDNENDIEMLRAAGLGVAMGNALDSVKAAADVVALDNDAGGIAAVLGERFGLGGGSTRGDRESSGGNKESWAVGSRT